MGRGFEEESQRKGRKRVITSSSSQGHFPPFSLSSLFSVSLLSLSLSSLLSFLSLFSLSLSPVTSW